jgi:hypothetical protein
MLTSFIMSIHLQRKGREQRTENREQRERDREQRERKKERNNSSSDYED